MVCGSFVSFLWDSNWCIEFAERLLWFDGCEAFCAGRVELVLLVADTSILARIMELELDGLFPLPFTLGLVRCGCLLISVKLSASHTRLVWADDEGESRHFPVDNMPTIKITTLTESMFFKSIVTITISSMAKDWWRNRFVLFRIIKNVSTYFQHSVNHWKAQIGLTSWWSIKVD